MGWHEALLDFWFGLDPARHWRVDPALDEEIAVRFGRLLDQQKAEPAERFLGSPDHALTAVILFDQFPRNMFRGHAEQFATDSLALGIARAAVDAQFDDQLEPQERGFLYMPFQHSEDLADQRRSVALFTALGDDYLLGFAIKHRDVIERFGRFPHRNAILGRAPRPAETAAGEVVPW